MVKLRSGAVGLDIGTRFIKLVELKKTGDAIYLHKYGIKEIPRDVGIDRDKVVSQLILQLLSENEIKAHNINISVGGQAVFIRFVKLLQTREDKLKQTMKFEAQNQIPFPLNEVAWDWSLLDKDKLTTKKAVIVAIKKNIVEEMVSQLNKMKLSINLIDVSPISLYNSLAFNEEFRDTKHSALLDVGEKTTNLIIFKQGNMWIRSFPIAGERIKESKAQGVEELVTEIERSIEYYFMQSGEEAKSEKKLDELILTGGGSAIDGIEATLVSRLNTKIKKLNPFKRLKASKDLLKDLESKGLSNQFAVAIGAALRGVAGLKIEVNFLKEMLLEKHLLREKKLYFRLSTVLAILIVIGVSVFMRQDYAVKRSKLAKINEMLDTYTTYDPKIKKIKGLEDVLQEKIDILYQTSSSRAIWLDVLKIISEILPRELWITDLSGIVSLEKNALARLDLSGKALSYQHVNSFVSALKESPNFEDVKPISSSIETDEETKEEVVKFSITMDVVVVPQDS